jgi:hypothetical protein
MNEFDPNWPSVDFESQNYWLIAADIDDWIFENVENVWWENHWRKRLCPDLYRFFFKHENDALMFALRWL